VRSPQDRLKQIIDAIDELLIWTYLSPITRTHLDVLRTDLESELQSLNSDQTDVAAAG
jgi:hypothetical protein